MSKHQLVFYEVPHTWREARLPMHASALERGIFDVINHEGAATLTYLTEALRDQYNAAGWQIADAANHLVSMGALELRNVTHNRL